MYYISFRDIHCHNVAQVVLKSIIDLSAWGIVHCVTFKTNSAEGVFCTKTKKHSCVFRNFDF